MKQNEITYYDNYIRQKAAKRRLLSVKEVVEDYDLIEDKVICKDVRLVNDVHIKPLAKPCCEFVPLSPSQANSISIDPLVVTTGKVRFNPCTSQIRT